MRIASLLASGTEIVCGLGLEDHLVAISHECDYPAQVSDRPRVTQAHVDDGASSADIDRQVRAYAVEGRPLYDIDRAMLAELAPDIIITQSQCAVCAVSLDAVKSMVADTAELHPAQIVDLNPNTLAAVYDDIRAVGRICARSRRADAFVAALQGRVEAIARHTETLSHEDRPEVACLEWTDPPMIAGNWMPELLELAGGRCAINHDGRKSPFVDWPVIFDTRPEVIVIMPCGFDLSRALREGRALAAIDGWDDLPAVKTGRVHAVDGNAYFNRSGPRLVDSLEILAYLVQPGLFSMPDVADGFAPVTTQR